MSVFLYRISLEIQFNNVLEIKQTFLHFKGSFKNSRKISIFIKGLTHDLGLQFKISYMCVFV